MKLIAENKERNITTKKGYSLVEVLVSLIILSLGLLGVVYLMNSNVKSSENSRDQIIASELAQEGIEIVLNTNANATTALSNGSYSVDYVTGLGSINNESLNLNGGFYTAASGTKTKYLRRVDISGESGPGSLVTVTSTVSWNNSSIPAAAECTIANQCMSVTAELVSNM